MKKEVILISLVLTCFLFVNLVSARDLVSDAGVQYEDRILSEFSKIEGTNEKFVDLIIYLKNISDADALISGFSSDEIGRVINRHLSNMISIEMTEEAFLKLIQDDRIESVYYNAPVDLVSGNLLNKISSNSILIILLIIILFLIIIIYLKKKRKNAKKK